MTVIFLLHLHVLISCEDDSHYNVKIALGSSFETTAAQKFGNSLDVSVTTTKPRNLCNWCHYKMSIRVTLSSTCIVNCQNTFLQKIHFISYLHY
jgi:hypothetical protein